MSRLVPFHFEAHEVRVFDRSGQPWFVLADVCRVLGMHNPRNVAARLDADEKGVCNVDTLGGSQKMTIINESGLWATVMTSRKPAARRFRKWVTAEVIPAIRQTGHYGFAASVASEAAPMSERPLAMDIETPDGRMALAALLDMVRLALRVHGRAAAKRAWDVVGLPCLLSERAEEELAQTHPLIARWMEARLRHRQGGRVQSSALYTDYVDFAAQAGEAPKSQTTFSKALSLAGHISMKASCIYWLNIELAT